MVKCRYMFGSVLAALMFSASFAGAFVAQKPGDAISYNNFARDSVSSAPIVNPVDDKVDYNEIADKLLPEVEPEKISIDLRHKSARNVAALPGQEFFLILPETDNGVWHYSSTILETISTERRGNKRILEMRVLCCGKDKIFFDYRLDGSAKVTQSRILRLKVKKK